MTSPWRNFLVRSTQAVRDQTQAILRANPAPTATKLTFAKIDSQEGVDAFAKGSDADMGGSSTVNFDLGPEGKGRFWGRLSTQIQSGNFREGVFERGGYAGIRTRTRHSLFGNLTWDVSLYKYLAIRLRSSGDNMHYFINVQTSGIVQTDLYQHRIWLPPLAEQDKWEDILIPFSAFTLTNSGNMNSDQLEMGTEAIKSVGISVLGPKEGRYELGVESIMAIGGQTPAQAKQILAQNN